MTDLILSKRQLAAAFRVSVNTIDAWTLRGMPRLPVGRLGSKCRYAWSQCEDWLRKYKTWPSHVNGEMVIIDAYRRAVSIVNGKT